MKYKKLLAIIPATVVGLAVCGQSIFAETAETEVTVTINPIISLSVDSDSVSTSLGSGSTSTGKTTTATVSTNDLSGYTLTVADKDSSTALTSGSYSIPTGTTISAGTSAWAIRGSSFGSHATTKLSTSSWTAMVASGSSITVVDSGTLTGGITESTKVEYGVSTSTTQAAGTYTDTIVYTATAKAS